MLDACQGDVAGGALPAVVARQTLDARASGVAIFSQGRTGSNGITIHNHRSPVPIRLMVLQLRPEPARTPPSKLSAHRQAPLSRIETIWMEPSPMVQIREVYVSSPSL